MLFNSFEFLIFALIFFTAWYSMRRFLRARLMLLVGASFLFYGWWDYRYVFLLAYTGFIDFSAGILMERFPSRRKLLVGLSLCGNVGALAIFKYAGFASTSVNALFNVFGIHHQFPVLNLLLPVGISFYTFESLSYTIDVYRGKLRPTHDLLQFFTFLSLFPHLVAGPVVRPHDLLPQILADRRSTEQQQWDGIKLIGHGLFKKMVIADNIAPIVNQGFGNPIHMNSAAFWWIMTIMFTVQVYCDFSGYTDIARGLAKWMGYEFPINFNHPLIASSMKDYWARWHISLCSWFRDYVYIPLGGSRKGKFAAHKNMWITMVLSGLWHGAAWHFILWGALHGFFLTIEKETDWPKRLGRLFGGRVLTSAILIAMISLASVLFRASGMGQAVKIISTMFSVHATAPGVLKSIGGLPTVVLLAMVFCRESCFYLGIDKWQIWKHRYMLALDILFLCLTFSACIYLRGAGNAFVYFQF